MTMYVVEMEAQIWDRDDCGDICFPYYKYMLFSNYEAAKKSFDKLLTKYPGGKIDPANENNENLMHVYNWDEKDCYNRDNTYTLRLGKARSILHDDEEEEWDFSDRESKGYFLHENF